MHIFSTPTPTSTPMIIPETCHSIAHVLIGHFEDHRKERRKTIGSLQ